MDCHLYCTSFDLWKHFELIVKSEKATEKIEQVGGEFITPLQPMTAPQGRWESHFSYRPPVSASGSGPTEDWMTNRHQNPSQPEIIPTSLVFPGVQWKGARWSNLGRPKSGFPYADKKRLNQATQWNLSDACHGINHKRVIIESCCQLQFQKLSDIFVLTQRICQSEEKCIKTCESFVIPVISLSSSNTLLYQQPIW